MESDHLSNESITSASSNESPDVMQREIKSSKTSIFKTRSTMSLEKKREKKWKKNKIGKEDFYNKTAEFRCWLKEKKNTEFDQIGSPDAKKLFKKFVKKWNNKKLDKKYYSSLDVYWTSASPSKYYNQVAPMVTKDKAREKVEAQSFTPLYDQDFSTFGKKTGKRALKELQLMGEGTPVRAEQIYAEPCLITSSPGKCGILSKPHIYEKPEKPDLNLVKLFEPTQSDRRKNGFYASVRRRRPLTCYGKIENMHWESEDTTDPSQQLKSSDEGTEEGGISETTKGERPCSEYVEFAFERPRPWKKQCSTASTSSTESEASTCSFASSISNSSSQVSGGTTGGDDISISSRASSSSRRLRPKPPPRSSSISKHSKKLREVAKAVIAKQMASPKISGTPKLQTPIPFKSRQSMCQMETPSPPPPPPPLPESHPDGLNSSILPSPPAECKDEPMMMSPALPPPPPPEQMVNECTLDIPVKRKLYSDIEKSQPHSSKPFMATHFKTGFKPKPVIDSIVSEIKPSPARGGVVLEDHITTPMPKPKVGPNFVNPQTDTSVVSCPVEQSKFYSQNIGATPANKINIKMAYDSSNV